MTDMADYLIQYLDWLATCRRSPRTIAARADILSRMDRALPHGVARANGEELKAWIYQPRYSANTVSTYYGAASAFFVWATSDFCADPLDYNPMGTVPRPPRPRVLPRPCTDEQLQQVLTEATEPYRLWALLAAYQGLRCCEIATLRREHIDEDGLTVVKGKGNKPAILPTSPLVWVAVRDLPGGPIAWTDRGTPAGARWVSIRFAQHMRRRLGLPGVSLHRMRHWYGTTIYRATRDPRLTQELLRHESLVSTAGYTLIGDEERQAAIRALPTMTGARQA